MLVMLSPTTPLSLPAASVTVGVAADASMVNANVLASELLPATSVSVALIVCLPSANAAGAVKLHVPVFVAVVVPTNMPSIRMLTVAPASALPVSVGCVALVPLFVASISVGGSATSSMVSGSVATATVEPFVSSSLALIVCVPLAKFSGGTKLHVP